LDIEDIIILGGGSAGWMTASTLIKIFPKKNITVIESPDINTVGVGESTLGQIREWTSFMGISDKDLLSNSNGSYKLSIKFNDFYKKGESFHYPLGDYNLENTATGFNDWWFKKFIHPETPNSDYADCFYPSMSLVKQNKISEKNVTRDSAFHFDASMFANWLKKEMCLKKGVKHIIENIGSIEENEEGIVSLNGKHKASLYIDCTGFKSLLLNKTLKEPFESYEHLLPNNSAWATKLPYTDKEKQLVSYTDCTAYNNGWVWNIPLWSRIGTGYVYSDKFISDDDALKEFKEYLGRDDLEFKKIKMKVGIHKRLWVKNVVAIGLSAGFIEPLESNGLLSVHQFLFFLIRNLNRGKISQWDKDSFTFQCKKFFKSFSEFVALHYALSHRDDTPYWKNNLNKNWSESLINLKTDFFSDMSKLALARDEEYGFSKRGGLHCVTAGMNYGPTEFNTIKWLSKNTDNKYWENKWLFSTQNLNDNKKKWDKFYKNSPSLIEYLNKNIYN